MKLLEAFVRQPVRCAYEIVRANWSRRNPALASEANWRKC